MKIRQFAEQTTIIAEHQDEYESLPAHVFPGDKQGKIAFCFELDDEEKKQIEKDGKIWFQVLTFGHPLQPILGTVQKPEMVMPEKN